MARIADVFRFRAEAVRLNWPFIADKIARPQRGHPAQSPGLHSDRLRARSGDIRVTWAAAKELGVPYGPFTVWTRDRQDDRMDSVEYTSWWTEGGLAFWWGGTQAARVRVQCDVGSTSQPVGLFLFRTTPSLYDAVASAVVQPSSNTAILDLPTSGAVMGLLVNGSNPRVSITRLDDVIQDGAWKPLEIVGLPVEGDWGTEYDTSDQGPVDNLMSPRDAAAHRLLRGGPPFGWHPVTQTGRLAPEWSAPDTDALIDEVQKFVLPEIAGLYDGSVPEYDQWRISNTRAVTPPQQGGKQSALDTTADARPWAALNIPAHSDAFLNLVTGFGSCYSQERMLPEQIGVGGSDFLITAEYREIAPAGTGSAEFAAFAPQGIAHAQTPAPAPLTAARSGLVPPPEPDLPWRETVRLNWKLTPSTAGLGTPTESALARYSASAGEAEALIDKREPTGWRPLVLSADAPKPKPGSDRTSVVDGGAEIPLGSGGRQVGYTVAVSDVYGVWSRWSDAPYAGDEPGPEGARLVSVALTTHYAGGPACPAALDLEVASEWLQRRTRSIAIVALFFPMATPTDDPPAGFSPDTVPPPPTGCFRRDLRIDFVGDDPVGVGCDVTALNADGTGPETPGPDQGDGGRRYAVHAGVPTLDFGTIRRWGVQLWVRRDLFVGASPSGWSPDAGHPALASAASPVPVEPLPIPPLPGVPLASLPDAHGRAHARVAWSLPTGAAVRRTAIWECAETAVRQTVGLAPQAPDTDPPGARLLALRTAYDALSPAGRRRLFRRLTELDGAVRDYDAVLPKGSTDIHLFAVTTITDSGVESPWPSGTAESTVRAVMAPRLRHPAPPLVRSRPGAAGNTVIELSSTSPVPVSRFRLLRTRSEAAARRADTMGPAFAEVTADATVGPVDVVTGDPVYTASWTGAFPANWDDWFVRAIAIPVDQVPVQAIRGMPSDPSDVVSISVLPDGPPDLAPLVVETDAAHTGIVVRTSTAAPVRTVAAGDHRGGATAGAVTLPFVPLKDLPETLLATPPAATEVVLERGVRASGRTPLALWFTRPVAADPVDVAVRVIDPLGRVTERVETVPGWVPPPVLDLSLVDVFVIVGRGVAVVVTSDAPVDPAEPYELGVRATQRQRRNPFPPQLRPLERPLTASMKLQDIPRSSTPSPRGGIQFGWRRGEDHRRLYDIWIPLGAPLTATITLVAPDGGRISVTAVA